MVAEIRRIGSRTVLFTNDPTLYNHLNRLSLTRHKVRYLQNGKLVGIDFYFDRRFRKIARRVKNGQLLLGI